jgi:hypothetical protein
MQAPSTTRDPTVAKGLSPGAAGFLAVFVGLIVFVLQSALGPSGSTTRFGYVAILAMFAAFTIAGVRNRSGPHSMLPLVGAVYFLIFGMAPFVQNLGLVPMPRIPANVEGVVQAIAIVGFVCLLLGFLAGSTWSAPVVKGGLFQAEWPRGRAFIWGTTFWLIGLGSYIVAYMLSDPGHGKIVTVFGIPQNVLTNLTTLYALGAAIVVYCAFQGRSAAGFVLLAVVGVANLLVGYWGNTKEMCLLVPVLMILVAYFTTGRVPLRMITVFLILILPFYWAFDSRRALAADQTPTQLLQDIGGTVAKISKNASSYKNPVQQNSQTLVERIDGYQYLLVIVDGLSNRGRPSQQGYTLMIFVYSFVPRFWWHDKPDLSTGQLFNRTFQLSESALTYIPSTQLGEWYWNFRWAGVIIGMFLNGLIIGAINRALDLRSRFTAPRLVAFVATVQFFVLSMGTSLALPYVAYLRGIIMLGVVHFFVSIRRIPEAHETPPVFANLMK